MSRPDEPTLELETARSRLLAEAEVLAGVVERLHGLAESLPVPEDDETPAAEIPDDVPSFMAGAAVCTADDTLRPAIAQLRRAAAVTRQELRRIAEETPADNRRSTQTSAPRGGPRRKETESA